jgi:hypothetical protein
MVTCPDWQPFQIFGQWGQEVQVNGETKYVQTGEPGDYICTSLTDPLDMWIVKRKLFESTYELKLTPAI